MTNWYNKHLYRISWFYFGILIGTVAFVLNRIVAQKTEHYHFYLLASVFCIWFITRVESEPSKK